MQGTPETMQNNPTYDDVISEILIFLETKAEEYIKAGINEDKIIIDPGIGFGKTSIHNLTLLGNLITFVNSGYSVLLGASRKRFMGDICNVETPSELIGATTATTAIGVQAGVKIFRVHDVMPNRQAADTAWAILSH
jgi:dihydropteroate synthase